MIINSIISSEAEALAFLALHEGSCSVPYESPLGLAFLELAEKGEVTASPSTTKGQLDVYSKTFKPKYGPH